jgi:tetratricopeptide (TPR) repeat protein
MKTPYPRSLLLLTTTALLFLLFSSGNTLADEAPDKLFQQGNAAYDQKNFDTAIACYEKIIRENGYSAAVLYNLGNSYAEKGQIGRAILNYERARRLKPGDPDILGNLEHLRKAHGLFLPEPSFFQQVVSLLELDSWTGLAVVAFIMLATALAALFFLNRWSGIFRSIAAGSFLLLILSSAGAFACFQSRSTAIITGKGGVEIGISPFTAAASGGRIEEGRGVRLGATHKGFVHIVDATKRTGWVPLTSISAIDPQDLPESNEEGEKPE